MSVGLVCVRVYVGLCMRICPCIAYMYAGLYLCISVRDRESVRAYPVTAHVPAKLRPVGVFTKLI
jgi:hypothetical protein